MCFSEASIFLSPRSARRESATAYATRMSTLLNASSISRSDGGCRMVRDQKSEIRVFGSRRLLPETPLWLRQ
jgi:hypothetical protein